MRTRRAVIACVIALGLLMVSSISALAQSVSDEKHEIEAWVQDRNRASILFATPVLDSPFSADGDTTWWPASNGGSREWRVTARYYRDSLGRVRVEQTFIGHATGQGPQKVIIAADPGSQMVYALDPAARTARKVPRWYAIATVENSKEFIMPVTMWCVIGFFRPGLRAPMQEELLGQQTIDGVRTEGRRVRALLPLALGRGETIDEQWTSPELKLDVYGRSEDADIGVVEHRLTTISRTEPRPDLFEVPADYKLLGLHQGGTWLNPYSPEIWPKLSSLAKSHCGKTTPPGF